MKKIATLAVSMGLLALVAVPVMAGPWGHGMRGGWGANQQFNQQLTPQQQEALNKARSEFLKESEPLRKQIATKRIELRTLTSQPNYDQAKVQALANQLADLQAQMIKLRTKYFGNLGFTPGSGYGPGMMGPGYGRGMMGRGMGRGMMGGYGPGMMGPGYGPGMMGGYGYYCPNGYGYANCPWW